MAKVFLIVGKTGAGKTTFSQKLAIREDAHIFSVDAWLNTLFMMDVPSTASYEWTKERVDRIETLILQEAAKLLDRRINIILDFGFFSKEQRMRVQNAIHALDHEVLTYFLDVDETTRWQRIENRDPEKTVTLHFPKSKEVFYFSEALFEPLDENERNHAIRIDS